MPSDAESRKPETLLRRRCFAKCARGLDSFLDVTAPHVTNITLFVEAESPVPGTPLYTVHLVQVESPASGTPLYTVYLLPLEICNAQIDAV